VAKSSERTEINIVLVGEFSSGKSSLLNWLMENEVLDVDIIPTTSEIYKISYDSKESEKSHLVEGIKIYELRYPFNRLKILKNVVLWDIPGLNSSDEVHEKCIDYALNHADAFILVVDCSAGTIKKNSLDRLIRYVDKPIAVLISKADKATFAQIKRVEQQIRKEIDKYFKNAIFFGATTVIIENGATDFIEAIERLLNEVKKKKKTENSKET